eukprot:12889043-Prorocentrum_lima.AAC.1
MEQGLVWSACWHWLPSGVGDEKNGAEGIPSQKGYVVKAVCTFMEMLCLSAVEIVSEGEPAMTELIQAVRQARLPLRTTLRQAAPHSKGTVGPADAVIRH